MRRRFHWVACFGLILIVACVLHTVFPVMTTEVTHLYNRWIVHIADAKMGKAYEQYATGSFSTASNALVVYIDFLQKHQRNLSGTRHVDNMLLVAHAKMANMMAYSGNTETALHHLAEAYSCHKQASLRLRRNPKKEREFFDSVFDGMAQIDERTGANWKHNVASSSNSLQTVSNMFLNGVSQ